MNYASPPTSPTTAPPGTQRASSSRKESTQCGLRWMRSRGGCDVQCCAGRARRRAQSPRQRQAGGRPVTHPRYHPARAGRHAGDHRHARRAPYALLIGDVDWTLPSRVVTCLHAHGYGAGRCRKDDATIRRRLARTSEALRVCCGAEYGGWRRESLRRNLARLGRSRPAPLEDRCEGMALCPRCHGSRVDPAFVEVPLAVGERRVRRVQRRRGGPVRWV